MGYNHRKTQLDTMQRAADLRDSSLNGNICNIAPASMARRTSRERDQKTIRART